MNHIEIELRYEVLKPEQLVPFLASFEKLHQKHDVDIYLDNPQALLYQKGIFIRIRNGKKLDIKFNRATLDNPDLAIQDYCEEHSFALPLQEKDLSKLNKLLISLNLQPMAVADLEHLKSANNFDEHYRVDKMRTSYKHDSFTVCLDEVADLGMFLEIELMANTIEDLAAVKQQMQQLIKGLDLAPLKTGYGTLLLRKKHFEHYLQGRFILEEDKIYRKSHRNKA
jgi:predicted adenylyl cyclase CyaB